MIRSRECSGYYGKETYSGQKCGRERWAPTVRRSGLGRGYACALERSLAHKVSFQSKIVVYGGRLQDQVRFEGNTATQGGAINVGVRGCPSLPVKSCEHRCFFFQRLVCKPLFSSSAVHR